MLKGVRGDASGTGLLQVALVALLVVAAFVNPAVATTIDFGGAGGSGSVSWTGLSTDGVVGSNLLISQVALNNRAPSSVTSGILSFTTGAFTGLDAQGFYNFASGGSLSIVGGVPAASISAGTLLLSAGAVAAQFHPNFGPAGFRFSLTIPFGSDTKNPALLTYFGLDPSTTFTFSGTLTGPPVTVGANGVTANVASTDILNTAVPEPSSLLLAGSGLVAAGFLVSRKLKHHKSA